MTLGEPLHLLGLSFPVSASGHAVAEPWGSPRAPRAVGERGASEKRRDAPPRPVRASGNGPLWRRAAADGGRRGAGSARRRGGRGRTLGAAARRARGGARRAGGG